MARGFESKQVEDQQAEAARQGNAKKQQLSEEELAHKSKRHAIELDMARVRASMAQSSNESYRAMLQKALDDLERKLEKL